tara:strand:- start:2049 stop:3953 length:1905 start_codon:yes stop_codon:yes gene_type:complete
MKLAIIISVLSHSFLFSQVSITDINRIGNQQLEEIKKELQNQPEENLNFNNVEDIESTAVIIEQEETELVNEGYYGYNYFKSEINFFDNVPTPSEFKLGAGDEIVISLWGDTNLREQFIINKEGLIYYENIGFINLSNKTIKDAENLLVTELSKIYSTLKDVNNPTKLMVELGKLKSLNIYFSGEVSKPGIQLVHPFSDILTAITQAGGVNIEGSLRNIKLIRDNNIIAVIDFYSFFIKGSNEFSDFRLIDGDTIHIPPVKNRVEIQGSILRPGYYELLQGDSLNDLINYAAGLKPKASSIISLDTVIPFENRTSQDNIISSLNINLNVANDIKLNNGDKVMVREIGDSNSKVEIFGRVKVPGLYSATNMTLKDILDFAGGFDDPVFRKTIREDEIIILRKDENQFYSQEIKSTYADADKIDLNINDKIFVYESINYRNSPTYRVEGEVVKPGTYPLRKGITLERALSLAGGLTELSTLSNIVISQEFTEIDETDLEFTQVKNVANFDLDFELSSNTVIKALPFENVVSVEGNVYNPGLVAFVKGITMSDAIIQAGGYKPYSIKNRAYVKRANGEVSKANIFLGRLKRLNPGDTVFVPVDPDPDEFDITTFIADLSTTLANIAAILLIADNQND